MAFGNLITDGTQVAVGTYGYVASFDYSAERIQAVTGVQLQDADDSELSDIEQTADTEAAVMGYAEDANCPNFAWCANGSTVYVFCKTSVYPYSSATRLAVFFQGEPEPIAATSDTLIPDRLPAEAKELFKGIVLQNTYNLTGARIPREVTNTIAAQKAALGV